MSRSNRSPKAAVRLLLALFAAPIVLAACGGGGGGGPTAPPPPSFPPLADAYDGSVFFAQGDPPDHCFSRWLALQGGGGGHQFDAVVRVRSQTETTFVAEVDGRALDTVCRVSGTRGASGATWQLLDCSVPCAVFDHPELPCPAIEVCVTDDRFTGTAGPSLVSGDRTVVWEATDAATGAPLGAVEITGTIDVQP